MYPYRCYICNNEYRISDYQVTQNPYPVCYKCKEQGWVEINNGTQKPKKEVVSIQK
jgi:hypothetical protein